MKKFIISLFLFGLLGGLISCSSADNTSTIRVACAASLQPVFEALKIDFEQHHPYKLELISNASGNLFTQIMQGAPYHLFFSADMDYPQQLYLCNLARKPFRYAKGQLVLVYNGDKNYSNLVEVLTAEPLQKIALADTALAPYGRAAKLALMEAGLWSTLKEQIVYAESIGQVNQYLKTNAVDAGFTSKTAVQLLKKPFIALPLSSNNLIEHGAAMLLYGQEKNEEGCEQFLDYLEQASAKRIFRNFGLE